MSSGSVIALASSALLVLGCSGNLHEVSGDADGGAPDSAKLVKVTNNATGCGNTGVIQPTPSQYGYWQAARLVPSTYPFTVAKVEYALWHDGPAGCRGDLSHKIRIFKEPGAAPSATPKVLEERLVPAGAAATHVATHDLATPITLAKGESLFVAIELVGTSPTSTLCIQTCGGVRGTPDKNWWSKAAKPPFKWVTFASFDFHDDALVAMWGR